MESISCKFWNVFSILFCKELNYNCQAYLGGLFATIYFISHIILALWCSRHETFFSQSQLSFLFEYQSILFLTLAPAIISYQDISSECLPQTVHIHFIQAFFTSVCQVGKSLSKITMFKANILAISMRLTPALITLLDAPFK